MTKKQIRERMETLLSTAEKEARDFNDQEAIEWSGLEIALKAAELSEGRSKRSIPIPQPQRAEGVEGDYREAGLIGGLGEYRSLFYGNRNATLRQVPYTMATYIKDVVEGRNMLAHEGAAGGFAAPEQWAAGFFSSINEQSIFLPLCKMYPMKGYSALHVTAWDNEDQSGGVGFGGVTVEWKAEGGTFDAKAPKIRTVKYSPNKMGIFVNVSREAAQDATGLVAELGSQMTKAVAATFDDQIVNGSGVARPLGILQSQSRATVNRAVVNQISFADVVNVYSRLYPPMVKGACWFASPDALPQLLTLQDSAGHIIWLPGSEGIGASRPGNLLGLPLYLSASCPKLGTAGDLILANLGAFGIAINQDVVLEKSESAEWYKDLYSFRCIMRADGGALMDSPITPKNGGASLSWAVVLQ